MHSTSESGAALFVRGGRIVDAAGERQAEVSILSGRVSAVDPGLLAAAGVETLDTHGRLVPPGLSDPREHVREPGLERKAGLARGALAAIAGGLGLA